MSALGELLELLHGPPGGRYQTVDSRWRVWRHDERVMRAFRAHAEGRGGSWVAFGSGEPQPAEHEHELRVVEQRPDRMREERSGSEEDALLVQLGTTWWSWTSHNGAMTNDGDEHSRCGIGQEVGTLLEPSRILGLLEIEPRGHDRRLDRNVLLATCRPRALAAPHDDFPMHSLGHGAEEHHIEIDAERGVLLRHEARFAGEAMVIREALAVTFDTDLDPDLFVFSAPDGTPAQRFDEVHVMRHGIALHEAAAAMPFTVYALSHAPEGWELDVHMHLARERPPLDPGVHLHYRSPDASAQLNVSQSPAGGHEDFAILDGEEIDHGGRPVRIRRRDDTWPQAQLSTTIGDTQITMNSNTLHADDLLALLDRLTPASGEPPRL